MSTIFVSHDKNASKKKFQKPNILRRKPKVRKLDVSENNESPNFLDCDSYGSLHIKDQGPSNEVTNQLHIVETPMQEIIFPNIATYDSEAFQEAEFNVNSNIVLYENNAQINSNSNLSQSPLNIESFLNGTVHSKEVNVSTIQQKDETLSNETWCLDFMNDRKGIIIKTYDGSQESLDENSELVTVVPSVVVSSVAQHKQCFTNVTTTAVSPAQTLMVDCFSNRAVKYKCDEPNCNKGFWSELKLKKHKSTHNKQSRARPTQVTIECPVKKNNEDGVEERCGRTFLVRDELLKHLNEEHTQEDAMYRCEVCGRRFFWATGLRAHAASHGARGALACSWPGCGRVFRQPCRLREHARAHTGDRPYPCKYPNCGWSFRSASKLVRHARRHTGERRHACGACGRAFLRREHLRDHSARYHVPHARHRRLCTHPGCEQTFTNMSSLYGHMKKVHRKDEDGASPPAPRAPRNRRANMFVVSLLPETQVQEVQASATIEPAASELIAVETQAPVQEVEAETEVEAEVEAEAETEIEMEGGCGGGGRAARTHCTWPLAARRHALYEYAPDAYVLEEDSAIEQSEGSENNIYTIRSDLFLHGNVLINEDSEFIVSGESAGAGLEAGLGAGLGAGGGGAGGGGAGHEGEGRALDLIDAHPTIDLMQDELMYADAAVDESSFRVFLMNGEELA